MNDDWSDRVEQFWATVDDADPDGMVSTMKALVDEMPADSDVKRYFRPGDREGNGAGGSGAEMGRHAVDVLPAMGAVSRTDLRSGALPATARRLRMTDPQS